MTQLFCGVSAVLVLGCDPAPFPGPPAATGIRDVPFVDTYNFGFFSGTLNRGSLGGRDKRGDLRIFSAADLRNLLAAANVALETDPNKPSGILNGLTVFGSSPAPGVELNVLDFDGNVVRDVFYNGLGGVPDFVATDGTSTSGSFTVFNVPVGEVFLIAGNRGLGVGHAWVFKDSISIVPVQISPLVSTNIGITGPVTNLLNDTQNVFPVEISVLGLQRQAEFSDDRGLLQVTPLVGFQFSLPSNSLFLLKSERADYETSYQIMDTDLSDIGDAVDLTRFIEVISEVDVATMYRSAGVVRQPGMGTVIGRVVSGQDSPSLHNRLQVLDTEGQTSGQLFYFDSINFPLAPNSDAAEFAIRFMVLNATPGPNFVRASAVVSGSGFLAPKGGGTTLDIFPDGVTLTKVRVTGAGFPDEPTTQVVTSMRGVVTLPDLITTVTDVTIDVVGYKPVATGQIRKNTRFVGNTYFIDAEINAAGRIPFDFTASNLLLHGDYVFKVSNLPGVSRYVDTFQQIKMTQPDKQQDGSLLMVKNLQVYTQTELETMAAVAGITMDPNRGVLVGRLLDVITLVTPAGIQLSVLDQNGDPVGEIRYMDVDGLPQGLHASSGRGEFVVFNVPPGVVLLHVVSKNDSGSMFTRVFAGGITILDRVVVLDAPEDKVPVSATVRGVNGRAFGGGSAVTFHGELDPENPRGGFLTTNALPDGGVDVNLGVRGQFIASVFSGNDFYKTHNMDVATSLSRVDEVDLLTLSRQSVDDLLATLSSHGRNIAQDPNMGLVMGEMVVRSWADNPAYVSTLTRGVVGPTAVLASRLNRDQDTDLVVADGAADQISVFFGDGDGGFAFSGSYPVGFNPVDLLRTDVDGDHISDVLVLNQGSSDVTVLIGTLRGAFREDAVRRLQVGNGPIQMARGDMDGDGRADDLVVLNRGSSSLSVFLFGDDRQFFEAPYSPFILDGSQPSSLVVRDLDPEPSTAGRLNVAPTYDDVMVTLEGTDTVETYLNSGENLFRQVPLQLASGSKPVGLLRFDINVDGSAQTDRDLEYIVLNRGTNRVDVVETVDGEFQFLGAGIDLDPGCLPTRMELADINGDINIDMVVLCSGNGTVTVYLGKRAGEFSSWQCARANCRRPPLQSGDVPIDLAVAKLDVRAGVDLAVINQFSDNLVIHFSHNVRQDGVAVVMADLLGNPLPDVAYLDENGQLDLDINGVPRTESGPSGRFFGFNMPPGNVWGNATDGDNGNRRYIVLPGEVTQGRLTVAVESPLDPVILRGQVTDAVASPQAGINLNFAGSGINTTTESGLSINGVYQLELPTNQNDGVMWLREQ